MLFRHFSMFFVVEDSTHHHFILSASVIKSAEIFFNKYFSCIFRVSPDFGDYHPLFTNNIIANFGMKNITFSTKAIYEQAPIPDARIHNDRT